MLSLLKGKCDGAIVYIYITRTVEIYKIGLNLDLEGSLSHARITHLQTLMILFSTNSKLCEEKHAHSAKGKIEKI